MTKHDEEGQLLVTECPQSKRKFVNDIKFSNKIEVDASLPCMLLYVYMEEQSS